MWLEDPAPHQIRDAFLKHVEDIHAQYHYSTDYRYLANELDIRVEAGTNNQAFVTPDGHKVILVNDSGVEARTTFSGLHEVSHHLFSLAYEGELKAFLLDYAYKKPELARDLEESFCYAAAAVLLMPTHLLKEALSTEGFSPRAVFSLASVTGASHSAALRRILDYHDYSVHAVLVRFDGLVLDSVGSGKRGNYFVGRDFHIEAEHPMRNVPIGSEEVVDFKAAVPFKGGKRNWKSQCLAARDESSDRTLAFFMDEIPATTSGMTPLFDF